MNEKALEKLVEEWRATRLESLAQIDREDDASLKADLNMEARCLRMAADQLAAVLAGGQEERALEDKYLRCDEHSPAPFGTPSCLFCELTKRQAEIERVESRERALVEAGRRAFGSLDAVGCECDAEYGSPGEVCIYCGLKAALSPYPPSEKEGEKV